MHESAFTNTIHKKLPTSVYRWKIQATMTGGIPDAYYSGDKADIWIEYKLLNKLPKRQSTLLIPKLSGLQSKWLKDRYTEGRNVAVILGHLGGSYIFTNLEWEAGITQDKLTLSRGDLAQWIAQQVNN
mgnify:FL=1